MKRLCLLAAIGCLSCSSSKTSGSTVTLLFGALADQSGILANPTSPPAINLAVSDFNTGLASSTSFANLRFAVDIEDSESTLSVAIPRLEGVVDAGAIAMIVDGSGDTQWANALFYGWDGGAPINIPLVSANSSSPFTNNPQSVLADASNNPVLLLAQQNSLGWLFDLEPSSLPEAAAIERIALAYGDGGDVNGDGLFTQSIVVTSDPGSYGEAQAVETAASTLCPDSGITLDEISSTANATTYDFSPDITTITAGPPYPDMIVNLVISSFNNGLLRGLQQVGSTTRVIAGHTLVYPEVPASLGNAANGIEAVAPVVAAPSASGATFVTEYTQAAGMAPFAYDALFYDSGAVIMLATLYAIHANALTNFSQVTGPMVKDGLLHINDPSGDLIAVGPAGVTQAANDIAQGKAINYDGASGPCDWDANQRAQGDLQHVILENGAFTNLEVYDCVSNPTTCPRLP